MRIAHLCPGARQRIEALAVGSGWDIEYPRDAWRLRKLDTTSATATIRFGKITQTRLKDLAKRWSRWRLAAGTEASGVAARVRAITRLGVSLASPPVTASQLAHLDRQPLERYLAGLYAEYAGRQARIHHLSALTGFFAAIRRHGWDDALPARPSTSRSGPSSPGGCLPLTPNVYLLMRA